MLRGMDRRTLLTRSGAFGSGALLGGVLPRALLAQGGLPPPDLSGVRRIVDSYVSSRRVPNMVIAVGRGQQRPDFVARGNTSLITRTPVDADTLYRIYSMTKPVTGMAAMMLVDEGKIGLDQPVAEILPAFTDMQVQRVYDGPIRPDNLERAVRPITMRHLLTHTAGLGYSIVQEGPIARAYSEAGLVPALVSRAQADGSSGALGDLGGTPAPSLAEFVDRLATMPLVLQPGTRWSYGVGLDLMGRIIEIVSGMPFDAFLRTRIFEPCGMASTGFQVKAGDVGRFTANYLVAGTTLVPIDLAESSVYLDPPPFPFGGAGLVSSPRDYDRFLQMLVGRGAIDGRRVMSEAAVALGTSDLLPDTLAADDEFAATAGYGAGGLVGKGAQAGLYGWSGAAGTVGMVHMGSGAETGWRTSLFTQYMPGQAYGLQTELIAELMRFAGSGA